MSLGYISGDEFVCLQFLIRHAYHGKSIVHEMGKDGNPNVPAPIQKISEISAQQHTGQKTIELKVEGAEEYGGRPNDHMMVRCPSAEYALQHATE